MPENRRVDARAGSGGRPAGPVKSAVEAPRRTGPFRWIVVVLLAVSTLSLVAIAGLVGLIYLELKATDVTALKQDIAGVKTEAVSFHADVAKQMTAVQKSLSDIATAENAATLKLNDIALGLHKAP